MKFLSIENCIPIYRYDFIQNKQYFALFPVQFKNWNKLVDQMIGSKESKRKREREYNQIPTRSIFLDHSFLRD